MAEPELRPEDEEEDSALLSESAFTTLEGLGKWKPTGDPLSVVRNFWPSEAESTEALHQCCMAFKTWKLKPTEQNAAALAAARVKFYKTVT